MYKVARTGEALPRLVIRLRSGWLWWSVKGAGRATMATAPGRILTTRPSKATCLFADRWRHTLRCRLLQRLLTNGCPGLVFHSMLIPNPQVKTRSALRGSASVRCEVPLTPWNFGRTRSKATWFPVYVLRNTHVGRDRLHSGRNSASDAGSSGAICFTLWRIFVTNRAGSQSGLVVLGLDDSSFIYSPQSDSSRRLLSLLVCRYQDYYVLIGWLASQAFDYLRKVSRTFG